MAIGKISDFKSALALGGARPSLFDVSIYGPVATVPNIEALAKSQYQCSTTSIPGLTVTPMEKQYFGRTVKLVAIDFNFIDCWPSSFDAMELNYDTTNAMEEFSVTWEYNYYTSTAQDTSTALGDQE